MSTGLAPIFRDQLLDRIAERHLTYATVSVVEPVGLSQEAAVTMFTGYLVIEAQALLERARTELRRCDGPEAIVGAQVEHTMRIETRKVPDFVTGEQVTRKQRVHTFMVTFECTGRAPTAPRAAVLRVLGEWLLVSTVKYVEIGMYVKTPQGVFAIVGIDAKHNLLKLDHFLDPCDSFPLYAVGDAGT